MELTREELKCTCRWPLQYKPVGHTYLYARQGRNQLIRDEVGWFLQDHWDHIITRVTECPYCGRDLK